jgi:hypothetical protein
MKYTLYILVASLMFIACGDSATGKSTKIKDLAFEDVNSAKEYADLIIKTIRTNRDKVIFSEFDFTEDIDATKLNTMVKTYAQAIGEKRKVWEFVDYYEENGGQPAEGEGYDYTWYDERGRIAIQVNILPKGSSKGFNLEKLEFRSRIEILESEAFPGGAINDYKKILTKK